MSANLPPLRRPFPPNWEPDWQAVPRGVVVFLRPACPACRLPAGRQGRQATGRELENDGSVKILGHRYAVNADYAHAKVRVEVDFTNAQIRFFAIRLPALPAGRQATGRPAATASE